MPDGLPDPIRIRLHRHLLTLRPIDESNNLVTCFVETKKEEGLTTAHAGVIYLPDHIYNDLRSALHGLKMTKAEPHGEAVVPKDAVSMRSVFQAEGGFVRWELQTRGSEEWHPLPGVANAGTVRKPP